MPRRQTEPSVSAPSSLGESLAAAADAAAARTVLELGTAATSDSGDFEAAGAVTGHEADPDPHPGYAEDGHTHVAADITDLPSGSDPWTKVVLGSDFVNSTTANSSVTGLAFTPAANKTYLVEGYFFLRSAAVTTGPRPGCSWPSGLSDGAVKITVPNSNTALAFRMQGALTTQNAASTGVPTTTDSYLGRLTAIVKTGASPSGNFQITLASEVGASAVTMRAGSFLLYREVQ